MRQPKLDVDIKPVSAFLANAALDVAGYAQLVEELELLRDVRTAVNEIESGKGIPHREAQAELRRRFRG